MRAARATGRGDGPPRGAPRARPGVATLALLAMSVAGCSVPERTRAGTPAPAAVVVSPTDVRSRLEANRWELVYWEGRPVPHGDNGEPVILTFAAGRVSGHVGCNRLTAGYDIAASDGAATGRLVITRPAVTRKVCEPGRMAFESAFTAAFARATTVRLAAAHLYVDAPGVPTLQFHLRELQGF